MSVELSINIESLRHLADLNGVATSFIGFNGKRQEVGTGSLLKVLAALGVEVDAGSGDAAIALAIEQCEDRPWLRTLPACTVVRKGDWRDLWVHVDHGQRVRVWVELEDGNHRDLKQLDQYVEPRDIDGVLRGRATFEVPGSLPSGYHRVIAKVEDEDPVDAPLYVVPNRVDPSVFAGHERFWGVNAQAYSVSSRQSWGVGDSMDIADLAAICASEGADFLLVNPLHASETVTPMENSPYRPVSRLWLNVTYIRPEAIPEFAFLPEEQRTHVEKLRLDALNADDDALIERSLTWECKDRALRWIFEQPRSIHREASFVSFCKSAGKELEDHALWCVLSEYLGGIEFPAEYESPNSPAVQEFRGTHGKEIEYHKWLQWVVSEQLEVPNRLAHKLGMRIGIMADLAIGTHPNGSDYWANPGVFASGMYVGVPPDMYSQKGQNWTQPPWNPRTLEEAGYEPFKRVIRAALGLAGALRIDHILGLFRLWWLPIGESADKGTYVYFDHEAMVGILLLEAERNEAILIGEDLGTVEPWVRAYLNDRGILGTSVFWFEREDDTGLPIHAGEYRESVLATVNTHDLPPTLGYMDGIHTDIRANLGLLVDSREEVEARDTEELELTTARLREYRLVGDEDPSPEQMLVALHRYVARTPSRLVAAALVDHVGEKRPQNFPGTDQEYPNWRVPLAGVSGSRVWLEDLHTARLSEVAPADDSSAGDAVETLEIFAVMREEMGRDRRF